ncbi:MAG TPA: ribbon-helix-helix domain-containing protein [Candidatus Nanoarchaeia archaeon]|nr:ribbon-helix-helix domain-containing protein [Candidatus Nanoarchaeia archaeon]
MKQKLSITLDDDTVSLIEGLIQEGMFRNRSHAVEYSVRKLAGERKNG